MDGDLFGLPNSIVAIVGLLVLFGVPRRPHEEDVIGFVHCQTFTTSTYCHAEPLLALTPVVGSLLLSITRADRTIIQTDRHSYDLQVFFDDLEEISELREDNKLQVGLLRKSLIKNLD